MLWQNIALAELFYQMSRSTAFPIVTEYVSSKDSNQPAHLHKLISLCCLSEDAFDPWLPTECPVKTLISMMDGRQTV